MDTEKFSLDEAPYLRTCVVKEKEQLSEQELRRAILRAENAETKFTILTAPLPPQDQTLFQVATDGKVLSIGICCLHRQVKRGHDAGYEEESLEMFFDVHHDEMGYEQLIFNSDGTMSMHSHLPYPEMHSSAYPLLQPLEWQTFEERFAKDFTGAGCRWFFIKFPLSDVFRLGKTVGFNLCRTRHSGEYSSWNFMAGNGAPDASGFGILQCEPKEKENKNPFFFARPANDFKLAVTYDPPMCVVANHYTPQRLGDEMAILKSWGFKRIHWIDYSDWPSFWNRELWREGARETFRECGDFLSCAVEQAHRNEMEFIANFKIFDLGFNNLRSQDAEASGTITDFGNSTAIAIEEIAASRAATQQSNSAWRRSISFPITTLRLYSDTPLRSINPAEIALLVSDDNVVYRAYSGKWKFNQGVFDRSHERWTPAGPEKEPGAERNWFIELSELQMEAPFGAIQIAGTPVRFSQRGFMLTEAQDNAGRIFSPVVATKSTFGARQKYSFWKDWPGWANITEPLLQRREWDGANLGFALAEMTHQPTLLEPTHELVPGIWLSRIKRILDSGADGINLRLLCHHTGIMNYLQHAFAPSVVETFRTQFGRDPKTTPEDYERIRVLRGAALTQFFREADQLCRKRRKKFMLHFESGIEVPPHFDARMQLHWDYHTWLEEGITDEVILKFWTPYSRFVHREILPIAHRKNIPVHVTTRNLNGVFDARTLETLPRLARDARAMGFAGLNFYEVANMLEMNPEGVSFPKGMCVPAMERVRDAIR